MVVLFHTLPHRLASYTALGGSKQKARATQADGSRVNGIHTHTSQLAPLRRQAPLQRSCLAVHHGRRCRRAAVLARRAGPCGAAHRSVTLPWT